MKISGKKKKGELGAARRTWPQEAGPSRLKGRSLMAGLLEGVAPAPPFQLAPQRQLAHIKINFNPFKHNYFIINFN